MTWIEAGEILTKLSKEFELKYQQLWIGDVILKKSKFYAASNDKSANMDSYEMHEC